VTNDTIDIVAWIHTFTRWILHVGTGRAEMWSMMLRMLEGRWKVGDGGDGRGVVCLVRNGGRRGRIGGVLVEMAQSGGKSDIEGEIECRYAYCGRWRADGRELLLAVRIFSAGFISTARSADGLERKSQLNC
jgi:hypothetical protein